MQRKRGLHVGRPLRSPLFVHPSWLPAGALVAAHLAVSAYGGEALATSIALAVATTLAFFLCALVHELAHGGMARLVGARTADTVLYVFGGVSRRTVEPAGPVRDAIVAFAGPLLNAGVGGGLLLLSAAGGGRIDDFTRTLGLANIAFAALSLLPGLPLDGGWILADVLWAFGRPRRAATRFAATSGRWIGLALLGAGTWLLLSSATFVTDAAAGLWFVLTGAFVLLTATRIRRAARVAGSVDDATAGAWARPFAGRVPLEAAVPDEPGPFAVADDGRLAGILTTDAAADAAGKPAKDVMVPWTKDLATDADEPIVDVLQRLARHDVVVVLDEKGVARGVVDGAHVRARLGG